jgi:hypothetical protein
MTYLYWRGLVKFSYFHIFLLVCTLLLLLNLAHSIHPTQPSGFCIKLSHPRLQLLNIRLLLCYNALHLTDVGPSLGKLYYSVFMFSISIRQYLLSFRQHFLRLFEIML